VFFTQLRMGRDSKPFRMFKMRSMKYYLATSSGPRVTRFGRFLRASHLDELPQLLNVLRSEMSLVGPRPERSEIVDVLAKALPRYNERLCVKPGISGLAQVLLPPDTDLASVRRKLAYDLSYIQHLSLWLDLRILIATVLPWGRRYILPLSANVLSEALISDPEYSDFPGLQRATGIR
jgi:lipopolysaccharide/colanic/teichoic acid biosynthesis glycosyltransferase